MTNLRKLIYASGNLGKAFIIDAFEIALLFFLTNLMGLPPATAGTILCLTLIADACLTAAIGFTSDGLKLRRYRAGTLILVGAPLCFISMGSLFALPALHISSQPLVFALILAARLSFILIDLPHTALTPRIETDSKRRTSIETAKYGFFTLGMLIFSFLVSPAMNLEGNPHIERTLLWFGLICGGLGPTLVVIGWFAVRKSDTDLVAPAQSSHPTTEIKPHSHFFRRMRALCHRDYLIIFAVIALIPYTNHLFLKSLVYEATYVIGDVHITGRILAAMVAGQILGLPVWPQLARRTEKARTVQYGLAVMIVGFMAFYMLPHAGGWLMLLAGLIGFGICGLIPLIWSMAGDCIDLSFARSGENCRTCGFGMLTFASKVSLGISTLLFALTLQFTGYDNDGALPQSAMAAIHASNALLPAIISLTCLLLLGGYRLTYQRHRKISS